MERKVTASVLSAPVGERESGPGSTVRWPSSALDCVDGRFCPLCMGETQFRRRIELRDEARLVTYLCCTWCSWRAETLAEPYFYGSKRDELEAR